LKGCGSEGGGAEDHKTFSAWAEIVGDPVAVAAMVDRVVSAEAPGHVVKDGNQARPNLDRARA
jgi:hypothetical protein